MYHILIRKEEIKNKRKKEPGFKELNIFIGYIYDKALR